MTDDSKIISAALAAATPEQASEVQSLIATSVGAKHLRPVGDKWNNHGLMGASGSFDLKLIEPATNMQDAVIERKALAKWGTREAIPYQTPHDAAADLLTGAAADQAAQAVVTFRESTDSDAVTKRAKHTKRLSAIFDDTGCGLSPQAIPATIFGIGGSQKESALYLQGAFGMGGAMTYRNADAVVLVTRRAPELLQVGRRGRYLGGSCPVAGEHEGSNGVLPRDFSLDRAGGRRGPMVGTRLGLPGVRAWYSPGADRLQSRGLPPAA